MRGIITGGISDGAICFRTDRQPINGSRKIQHVVIVPTSPSFSCKHVAAAYYLLGEEFDRDPFLIFMLRGKSQGELLKLMRNRAGVNAKNEGDVTSQPEKNTPLPAEPIPSDPKLFWGEGNIPDEYPGEVLIPRVTAVLPKRLGKFPFWRGEDNFLNAMERIYSMASLQGMAIFLGEGKGTGLAIDNEQCELKKK